MSQFGDQAFLVVMMFWVKERTESASVVGLLMMLSSLPAMVFGPFAGVLADRHSRRRILIASDLLRSINLFLLAGVIYSWPSAPWLISLFFSVAVLNSAIQSLYAPTVAATIPELVPPSRVTSAASFNQVSLRIVMFLSQAGAGSLYRIFGAVVLIVIDALSFLFSAGCLLFVRIPSRPVVAARSLRESLSGYLAATREGFLYVRSRPGMWRYLWTSASLNFFFMPIFVLLPFYVEETLAARVDSYGYLMSAFALGGLLGSLLPGIGRWTGRIRGRLTIACLTVTPILFGLLSVVRSMSAALSTLFAVGLATGLVNVSVIALFQASTPSELRGRVMSLLIAMSRAVSPLGMAAGGVLGDLSKGGVPRIYLLCGLASLAVSVAMTSNRDFRAFVRWDGEH